MFRKIRKDSFSMSILPKWLCSTITLIIICLVVVGCRSNDVELPKEENKPPNGFDTPTSEDEPSEIPKPEEDDNSQKHNNSDIISDEDPLPDKDTELPKNPIPKGKIDKGEHNNPKDNTLEEKDSPVKNDN